MEDRVFIDIGYGRFNEIVRCDVYRDREGVTTHRAFTYADRAWGLYTWSDYGLSDRSLVLERDLPKDVIRFRVDYADSLDSSLTNSKYGTLEEIAAELIAKGKTNGGYGRSTLLSFLESFCGTRPHLSADQPASSGAMLRTLFNLYEPYVSDCGGISLYRNAVDYKRLRRTTMKPGRAFRHMFSNAPDTFIAEVTEGFIEFSKPRVFSFHSGYKAEDFAKAYDGDTTEHRNPRTTCINKSLSTSCMQGVGRNIDGVYHSVGEAYASGDFHIAWLEDTKGRIAGRVVVGYKDADRRFISGPVYGCCEQSLEVLNEYLDAIKAEDSEGDGWVGLTLDVVGCSDDPVTPYLDGDYSGDIRNRKVIEIKYIGEGEFEFANTDGHLNNTTLCDCCGSSTDQDDLYHIGDTGESYCECCFNESYTYTDGGDVISLDDAVHVHVHNSYTGGSYELLAHIDDCVYVESLDQHWHCEDVSFCEDREEHYPTHLLEAEEEKEMAA